MATTGTKGNLRSTRPGLHETADQKSAESTGEICVHEHVDERTQEFLEARDLMSRDRDQKHNRNRKIDPQERQRPVLLLVESNRWLCSVASFYFALTGSNVPMRKTLTSCVVS